MPQLTTQGVTIGFSDRAKSGCEHSASFKSVKMQNKDGGVFKNSLT